MNSYEATEEVIDTKPIVIEKIGEKCMIGFGDGISTDKCI